MQKLIPKTCALVALLATFVIIPYLVLGDHVQSWTEALLATATTNRSVTGLLLAGLLASDIILPVPSSVVSTGCGYLLGPVWGTVISFIGMSVGCVVGYGLGSRLGPLAAGNYFSAAEIKRLTDWHGKVGLWVLAISRPIPVLAEASTVFAGMLHLGWARSMIVTALMNLAISLLYAIAGSMVIPLNIGVWVMAITLAWLAWALVAWLRQISARRQLSDNHD